MRRISAADLKRLAALNKPKKIPKRQQESLDQKAYVKALNSLAIGFYYRVKNMGTYDAKRGFYRRNNEKVSIPDIEGYRENGKSVYIECKRRKNVEKARKLIFKTKFQEGQKEFLLRAHRAGCIVGVAFNLADALAIAHDDPIRYVRHPRTYLFLPEEELEAYAKSYATLKASHGQGNMDPVIRNVLWAKEETLGHLPSPSSMPIKKHGE